MCLFRYAFGLRRALGVVFLFKNPRFRRPHLHITKCYKSHFAIAPFSVVVWKFPNNSGRKIPIMQTSFVVPTEGGPAEAWPANICAEVKGAQDRESMCLSTPLALPHLCWDCSPQYPVLLKSMESPVGKPHLVFFSPSNSNQLMNVTRRLRGQSEKQHQTVVRVTLLIHEPCLSTSLLELVSSQEGPNKPESGLHAV